MKGLNAAQIELNEVEGKADETESEGIEISKATLKELKEKMEKLQSEDILMFLRQYRWFGFHFLFFLFLMTKIKLKSSHKLTFHLTARDASELIEIISLAENQLFFLFPIDS